MLGYTIRRLLALVPVLLGLTVIVTSHHVASSRRMADQIVLLFPEGSVSGSPRELAASNDPRVNAFLGVRPGSGGDEPFVELG